LHKRVEQKQTRSRSNLSVKIKNYDANITFRILVKIIHTVAGHTDDPE